MRDDFSGPFDFLWRDGHDHAVVIGEGHGAGPVCRHDQRLLELVDRRVDDDLDPVRHAHPHLAFQTLQAFLCDLQQLRSEGTLTRIPIHADFLAFQRFPAVPRVFYGQPLRFRGGDDSLGVVQLPLPPDLSSNRQCPAALQLPGPAGFQNPVDFKIKGLACPSALARTPICAVQQFDLSDLLRPRYFETENDLVREVHCGLVRQDLRLVLCPGRSHWDD